MTGHVGTREEWLVARRALLEREKELTRLSDQLAQERRELPWVAVEKEYIFEADEGPRTLAELFGGRSQLLVYNFMFGPRYAAGCPVCSSAADTFDGAVVHLNHRDVTFLCLSRAPLGKLQAYKQRMGWSFPWASSLENEFNFDFGVSFTENQLRSGIAYNFGQMPGAGGLIDAPDAGPLSRLAADTGTDVGGYLQEAHGLSAFALSDGVVYHTYSSYARGDEVLMGFYPLLDRAPKGRDETEDPLWFRRHDEYR